MTTLVVIISGHALVGQFLETQLQSDTPTTIVKPSAFLRSSNWLVKKGGEGTVLVVDHRSLGKSLCTYLRSIQHRIPRARIVAIGERLLPGEIGAILDAGARAYVPLDDAPLQLPLAIEAVPRRKPQIKRAVTQMVVVSAAGARCTGREVQVLRLIREGYSNKEISSMLKISESTGRFHTNNLFNKLGVRSRVRLVAKSFQDTGLLSTLSA